MPANSHKTAIARKRLSNPCMWLHKQGRLIGNILDWGCGKGDDVANLSKLGYFLSGYDLHFQPVPPPKWAGFHTILCTYVLNTIPEYHDRCVIVEQALEYLLPGGWLYVSIRADKKALKGWTNKGTWQGYVGDQLANGDFILIHRTANYEIWGWRKPMPRTEYNILSFPFILNMPNVQLAA